MAKLRYKLPPPNHLVTFEAAGRYLNFTKAAEELNVSRVSVSQQVKALETRLSVPLFFRLHRSLRLTKAGHQYHAVVSRALAEILDATYDLEEQRSDNSLTVTTTTGFSTYWLMPRIGRFRKLHPNIDLRFLISDLYVNFDQEDIDLAIRYGDGQWDGLNCTFLLHEEIMPACSAGFFKGRRKPRHAKDLLNETLIHLEGPYDQQTRWTHWFEAQNLDVAQLSPGLSVNTYTNLVQATLAGQGIALIGPPLIEQYLDDGNLICPLECAPITRRSFYLASPRVRRQSVAADNFAEWLAEEVSSSNCTADRQTPSIVE